MKPVFVRGVGLWGPGLPGWSDSLAVLRGEWPRADVATVPPAPSILSATERRRTGLAVRLALAAATDASAGAGIAPGRCRSIFATSNGDGAIVHAILEALTSPAPQVSPTQFHNSVHNAAAGYWSIGTGSQASASCLGCHDATFGAALLAAAAEVAVEAAPVLLCVYDAPLPFPLDWVRPTNSAFACALVLAPEPGDSGSVRLRVRYHAAPATPERAAPRAPGLQALALGNAAARGLRLLESIAATEPDRIEAEMLEGRLEIDVEPCPTASASDH